MTKTVFERIPAGLLKKGIDLSKLLGVNSFAWHLENALKVTDWCKQNRVAILGGDVIEKLSASKLSYTNDNWYMDPNASTTRSEYITKSVELATQKMTFYTQIHQSKILLFELVFK